MRVKIGKLSLFDYALLVCSLLQVLLMTMNIGFMNDVINRIIHINAYIIIFTILICLFAKGVTTHYIAFAFFGCFLIFLMGQKIFLDEKNVFLTFVRTELNAREYFAFLTILSFALVFTYYSYVFFQNNAKKQSKIIGSQTSRKVPNIVRLLYFITLPFAVYMQLAIVIVKSSMGYENSYLVNVSVPTIVRIAYYIFTATTMVYLTFKPKKGEAIFVLFIFLLFEGGVQLIQGRRALFAISVFFAIWYLLKYYNIKRLKYKYIFFAGAGLIVLIVLFYSVELTRGGKELSSFSFIDIVEKLMISTGGSDSVIANTIRNKDQFPQSGVSYLFDSIVNNPITNILSGKMGINQGKEYLESFNSFSHWISYLTLPELYFAGYGMGSCYLAEIYLAFGFIGVMLFSIVLGKIISVFDNISLSDNIYKNAIYFVMIKAIFTLPRDGVFSWFGDFIYLMFVLVIVYLFCGKCRVVSSKDVAI